MKFELQKGSRSKILAAIMFVVMAAFVARLFYLQIIRHDYYVQIGNAEQVKRLKIPAKRGLIYALDGNTPAPLVMNQTIYTVFADPQTVKDNSKIVDVIRQVAGGNARPNLESLLGKKDSRYQILATKITRTQADKIKAENLKGIGFQEGTERVYPEGGLAAQVLGFVDYEGVGKYGVESKLNDRLTGVDGLLQSVTDVSDVPLTIGNNNINKPAVNGENVVLSIDRNIQSHVEQALADSIKKSGVDKGSVVVMNPQNGKILAMANLPSYEVANFDKVQDASAFNNATVSDPYEPGSDIKTLTMATGIDKGVVAPDSTFDNNDYIKIDDRVIWNYSRGHIGRLTFQEGLNYSLNTAFVNVVQRLGDGNNITREARDTLYDYFHNKFLLGQKTGVELANEEDGTIISPEEADGNAVRYSNMAFGQGMDITMVQVASAFCSLINGSNYYKPTILAGYLDEKGKFNEKNTTVFSHPVSVSTANQMRDMVHITRNNLFGNLDKQGYYIGGKTGTSDVIKNGVYTSDESIATYLGYGGTKELSQYVIMVRVSGKNKAMFGSTNASPIFTDISNWMLDYLKIQPKG
ncbi:MAG: penicillin-binding protein 2 [Candidatus Saccharibacteria bacterium]